MNGGADAKMNMRLHTLPTALRVLFTCFLLTIGVGYLSALVYLFISDVDPHRKMGMGLVSGIAMKYHGSTGSTRLEAALGGSMSDRIGAEDKRAIVQWIRDGAMSAGFGRVKPIFDRSCVPCHSAASGLPIPSLATLEDVRKVAAADTGPSIGQLARVSHVHLFGISLIFLLTGAIFSLTSISSLLKGTLVATPFVAIWADIGSWWITRYEPVFATVVVVGGAFMGLALAVQILISLWEMWLGAQRIDRPGDVERRAPAAG
jgi:hypothetical protein